MNSRKQLAADLALELGLEAEYLGVPSCAYRVGTYTINRDGSIDGDLEAIHDFLVRHDLIQAEPTQPTEGTQPDLEADETNQTMITIPAPDITLTQFKNLIFMLYSKQALINRMTNSDCLCIPDTIIEALKQYNEGGLEGFTRFIDDSKASGLKGIDYRDGRFSIAFPYDESQPERWTVYAKLMNKVFEAAIRATRVFPEKVEPDEENEKYLAHTWLQRLGYHGSDFKADRNVLLGHLKGYCAFPNSDKLKAHSQKYSAKRREAKQVLIARPDLEAGDDE